MTSDSWPGASPRLGRGAFAAGFIALGCFMPSAPGAYGASGGSIEFKGMLNYDTFKRAQAQGVGIRITQSPGGTGAAAMVLGRAKGLVIDGKCQSACAWAFVQNKSACFTSRAVFDFHAAHDPGTGRRLTAATDYWLSTVGPALRSRLAGLRTSSSLIRLSAKEMTRYYPGQACGATAPRIEVAQAKPRIEAQAKPRTAVAAVAAPAPASSSTQVAAADAPPTASVWATAGVEAMRTAREDGIVVASLITDGVAATEIPVATPDDAEDTATLFVPVPASETPLASITFSQEATEVRWSGVVMSVTTETMELAAHREGATSDG